MVEFALIVYSIHNTSIPMHQAILFVSQCMTNGNEKSSHTQRFFQCASITSHSILIQLLFCKKRSCHKLLNTVILREDTLLFSDHILSLKKLSIINRHPTLSFQSRMRFAILENQERDKFTMYCVIEGKKIILEKLREKQAQQTRLNCY